jgi:Ser/Thr protein kinase RdoA (MazF antagonist)
MRLRRREPEVRPRFGQVIHADGTSTSVVFHPGDEPGSFVGLDAATEQPVVLNAGDQLSVDVIGAGQSVVFEKEAP